MCTKWYYLTYICCLILFLWSIHRAKPKRWFRVCWLCLDVFPERKVIIAFYLAFFFFYCFVENRRLDFHFICSLPWQGLQARTKREKYEKIRDKKVSTSIEVGGFVIIGPWIHTLHYILIFIDVLCIPGLVSRLSNRICIVLPLLPVIEVWW
jgi:hypothetical protein